MYSSLTSYYDHEIPRYSTRYVSICDLSIDVYFTECDQI